jgi:hypothetical protein
MLDLDIIISSASRPEFLKQMLISLSEKLKFTGKTRYIFHEDVLLPEKSKRVLKIIEPYDFDIVGVDDPPLGQPLSLDFGISKVESDYFLVLEDDWVFNRELPIDLVLDLMENNKDINQICFNKRGTFREKHGWKKVEIERDGTFLVTNVHWTLIPSVWRTSFTKKYWKTPPKQVILQWWWNLRVKQLESKGDERVRYADWMMENVGAYFLGKYGEPSFIKHIGTKTTRINAPNSMLVVGNA